MRRGHRKAHRQQPPASADAGARLLAWRQVPAISRCSPKGIGVACVLARLSQTCQPSQSFLRHRRATLAELWDAETYPPFPAIAAAILSMMKTKPMCPRGRHKRSSCWRLTYNSSRVDDRVAVTLPSSNCADACAVGDRRRRPPLARGDDRARWARAPHAGDSVHGERAAHGAPRAHAIGRHDGRTGRSGRQPVQRSQRGRQQGRVRPRRRRALRDRRRHGPSSVHSLQHLRRPHDRPAGHRRRRPHT